MAKEITEGKDFLGNLLIIGDLIAFTEGSSCSLCLARVVGFTPKMIKIDIITLNGIYTTIGGYGKNKGLANRSPSQVIKIPNNEDYFKDLPKAWVAKVFNINKAETEDKELN